MTRQSKTALIVEDDPGWSMIISGYLADIAIDSVVVSSAQAAIDSLDESGVDMVILDMLLALETGMALLGEVKSHTDLSQIPIMVCSSISGLSLDDLGGYGVRSVIDKTTMNPEDFKYEAKRLIDG